MEKREIIESLARGLNISDIKESFNKINNAYRGKKTLSSDLEIRSDKDAKAYALYRMPATYEVIKETLFRLKEQDESFIPKSILDIGSGTGASILAFDEFFEENMEITLVEEMPAMIEISKYLQNLILESSKIRINNIKGNFLKYNFNPNIYFDLIISSYMVNELNEKELELFIEKINKLEYKYLILIVPGTPEHFRKLDKLRSLFLEKGLNIVAPCCFTGPCNVKDNNWCHFYKRIERTRLMKQIKGGELAYEDEKFSYLILSKEHFHKKKESKNRILRHPQQRKGLISFQLCSKEGIKEEIFTKSKNPSNFKELKDKIWGDSIG